MVFCSECGTNLAATAKFCGNCGKSQSSSVVSSTPTSSGNKSISDQYLPGSIGTTGNIDKGISEAMGLTESPQKTLYTTETRGTSIRGKCHGCKMNIQGASIDALGFVWHNKCFQCSGTCGEIFSQTGNQRILEKDSQPYCEKCYAAKFSESCGACGKPVTGTVVKAMSKSWHSDCFKCVSCQNKLTTGVINKGGLPHCKACASKVM